MKNSELLWLLAIAAGLYVVSSTWGHFGGTQYVLTGETTPLTREPIYRDSAGNLYTYDANEGMVPYGVQH